MCICVPLGDQGVEKMPSFGMVESDWSQSVSRNGAEIQIRIYRQEHECEWSVEIAESEGLTTFSDITYPTEKAALETALRVLRIA